MKNKTIFATLLLLVLVSTGVYAYWTDLVKSEIQLTFPYEGYLSLTNLPNLAVERLPDMQSEDPVQDGDPEEAGPENWDGGQEDESLDESPTTDNPENNPDESLQEIEGGD